MIFHENHLLAEDSHEILYTLFCWQTILMKYHTLFLMKTRKDVSLQS